MPTLEEITRSHLQKLCDEIGPRPNGSAGNRAAADYIAGALEASGLGVERQPYACTDWEDQGTRLEINGLPVFAGANAFSPSCDVQAPIVCTCTLAELEAADLAGKIGVLYGDLTRAPLSAKAWFLIDERDKQIIHLLESKAPAALLTVQTNTGLLDRLIEDQEFFIPSATVPPWVGEALVSGAAHTVRLRIASRQALGESCNVVGWRAGRAAGRVILCAHYDTKIDTAGAMDNASGVAILLALAERLGRRELGLGLEVVAMSNEEYLPIGDDEYWRRREPLAGEMAALLNFDGLGLRLSPTTLTIQAHSSAFQAQVESQAREHAGVIWVEPWPQSNHSLFVWRGVPSLAFSSMGWLPTVHLLNDTADRIDCGRLADAVWLAEKIILGLQDKSPAWTRPAAE